MKSRLVFISAALATTAGLGFSASALSSDKTADHPAVQVARAWSTRGIDPNTFIVAHPARLQLIGTSVSEKDATRVADVK